MGSDLSIYIHIPFCEVKCGYCDFFSVPRGFEDFDLQREYVDALLREVDERSPKFSGRPVRSIFFGGGTPSLLDPKLMQRIISRLGRHFSWGPETEITLEANPKTVSLEKLKYFRSLGFNRLSIGVQSFQDRFLKALGRIHDGREARRTVEEARQAGFENISIDLIFALPGQSFDDWKGDLEKGMALETPHLSAYHLTIEPGTPFARVYGTKRARQASPLQDLPAEEEGVRMLQWTRERLERLCPVRMEPYEISNFSRPGFESVHNRNYWHYGDYLGFGTAAASFIKGETSGAPPLPPALARSDGVNPILARNPFATRRTNVRDLKKYLTGDWKGFAEEISPATAMGEFCMLALRTREGIGEDRFSREFGVTLQEQFGNQINQWVNRGWLKKEKGWVLSAEGILFSDEVAASFLPDL